MTKKLEVFEKKKLEKLVSDNNILEKTRKQLSDSTFDSSSYLSNQVFTTISFDTSPEPEQEFFSLLTNLVDNLTVLSQDIEQDVSVLQDTALHTESTLMNELESHSTKLSSVKDAVEHVQHNFDKAIEGSQRIGGRLAATEVERINIDTAMELMKYIQLFQSSDKLSASYISSIPTDQVKTLLPDGMRDKDWGTISYILHDLKQILNEINSEDVSKAQKTVSAISESVEAELLGEFDICLTQLMELGDDKTVVKKARQISDWLSLFNNGQSLVKRYIFTVVQRRIPSNAFLTSDNKDRDSTISSAWNKITDVLHVKKSEHPQDDNSSAGASMNGDDSDNEQPHEKKQSGVMSTLPNLLSSISIQSYNPNSQSSFVLIDHLSGLFSTINKVCQEQFAIIRLVFPPQIIAKVTRMLVQRIFNDPAFGIQTKVDSILIPQPPLPPLPLSDYLDALMTVREKLTALNLLLIECCSHPAMRGMGSEASSLRILKYNKKKHQYYYHTEIETKTEPTITIDIDIDEEEIMRSDAEIREFFDEQINHVLAAYLSDYFDKELTYVRNQYVDSLRKVVDTDNNPVNSKVSAGTILQNPHLRAERMKSISSIVKSVANQNFINLILSITTDAILRMESIGRDDKKLSTKIKELFIFQLDFIVDGLFTPIIHSCTTMLLKLVSVKAQNSSLPPVELFSVLAAISYGVSRIKSHFDEMFLRPFNGMANTIAVCKESRKKAFKSLESGAKGVIFAWSLCVCSYVEKLLTNLQSKYDYSPKSDPLLYNMRNNQITDYSSACEAVCKALIFVINTVKSQQKYISGLDLKSLFWRPFGRQIIGTLISHIRKQKISEEGSVLFMKDIQEYQNVINGIESAETIDMMYCLKEISSIYSARPDDVAKIITQDLRYLDTNIILALAHARFDSNIRGNANHWSKTVSSIYPSFKNESNLPWENKKQITVVTFNDSIGRENSNQIGPITLRKSSSALSSYQLEEILKNNVNVTNISINVSDIGVKDGQTVSLDISKLESGEAVDFTRMVPSNKVVGFESNNSQLRTTSLYLPSRPDDMFTPVKGTKNVTLTVDTTTEVFRPDLIANKPKPKVPPSTPIVAINNPMFKNNQQQFDKSSSVSIAKDVTTKTVDTINKQKQDVSVNVKKPVVNNSEKPTGDSNVLKKMSNFFLGK